MPELPGETGSTLVDLPAGFQPPGLVRMSSTALGSRRLPIALLAVLVVVLTFYSGWVLLNRKPPEPLRIAVLAPQGPAGTQEGSGLVTAGLLNATLSTLASLEGLAPLDPAQVGSADTPMKAARNAAAEEVIALELDRQATGARASLRRIAGADGRVLWNSSFPVPAGTDDRNLRLLADAVAVQLRQAYPERSLRPGVPKMAVNDRAYAELLRIKDRIDHGSMDLEPELRRLEVVLRDSPRFLEGHLLLADLAHSLFSAKRDPAILERGLRAARDAADLAPGDPRSLAARFRLALFANRPDEAEETLASLSRLIPGDPQLHSLAGQLAESRGDMEGAIHELTAAVEGAPSQSNLYRLADLEIRGGRTAEARRHLQELLARSPGHVWGLTLLAHLELREGDPRRAEQIYLDLLRRQPQRLHFTNLGLARSLLGRLAEAEEAYRRAMAYEPENPYCLLNLADSQLAMGREEEARGLYEQTLEVLGRLEATAELTPLQRMIQAQCLAHLGRARQAAGVTHQAVQEDGEDPEILYAASLVYSLVGDRYSALINAELALEKGTKPRWFTLPAFGPLRNDPDLVSLLRRPAKAANPAAAR